MQYGRKALLCDFLQPYYSRANAVSDEWTLAKIFANYTSKAWGPKFFDGCFYNSTCAIAIEPEISCRRVSEGPCFGLVWNRCMRDATRGPVAEGARSWYYLKCHELGYLQTAPASGLSTRPRQLTTSALLEQCKYIFGESPALITPASVASFNRDIGGGALNGTTHIFEVDYSDDPWKMATTVAAVQRASWPLTTQRPFMLLTCDGCGHCGAGVPHNKSIAIEEQMVAALSEWGIGAES